MSNNKFLVWFNVILVSAVALIGSYYLAPYYFAKKGIVYYSPIIFFMLALAVNIIGIFILKNKKDNLDSKLIKILIYLSIVIGFSYFFIVKYYLHLKLMYLAALLLGLGTMIVFAISFYKIKENKKLLPYYISLLVVLVIFLGKRLLGDYGIFLVGLGELSFLGILVYVYLKRESDFASKHFKVMLISAAGCFAWGLLQIYIRRINLITIGINLNHSYTFLGLFLGIIIPVLIKNYSNQLMSLKAKPKTILIIIISILPLMMGLIINVKPVASYLTSYLFTYLLVGLILWESVFNLMPPFMLAYVTAVFSPPLFFIFDDYKRLTRALVFTGMVAIALLLYKYFFKKHLIETCES